MDNKKELEKIVGSSYVLDDAKTLEDYSKDTSFATPCMPRFVVRPQNSEQIRDVVDWANDNSEPLIPVSSPGEQPS